MNGLPPTSTRTDSLFPYTTLVRSGRRAERRTGTAAVVTARGHDAECGLRREMPGQTELRQESLVGLVERDLELVEAGVAAAVAFVLFLLVTGAGDQIERDRKSTRLNSRH